MRGKHLGDFDAVDDLVKTLMTTQSVPNAALAVMAPDGRLVLAHAYTNCAAFPPGGGIADDWDGSTGFGVYYAEPTSRFRIGSISKLLTAATVLSLNEEMAFGWSWLDTPVVNVMGRDFFNRKWDGSGREMRDMDAYRGDTTILDLLRHHDPWCEREEDNFFEEAKNATPPLTVNSSTSCTPGDSPMRMDEEIVTANAWEFGLPVDRDDIRLHMNGMASNYAPGTVYGYSNYGYMLLSCVVEQVTGSDYESVVRRRVLDPLGMRRTRVGASRHRDRMVEEVEYYDWDPPRTGDVTSAAGYTRSVVHRASSQSERPWVYKPYGGFNMANQRGPGGWTSTVVDLSRLARDLLLNSALGTGSSVLGAGSVKGMITPSNVWLTSVGRNPDVGHPQYGMGMYADYDGTTGALEQVYVGGELSSGGKTVMRCWDDGTGNWWTFVLLFNKTVDDADETSCSGSAVRAPNTCLKSLIGNLKALIPTLSEIGIRDLFDDYTDSIVDQLDPRGPGIRPDGPRVTELGELPR